MTGLQRFLARALAPRPALGRIEEHVAHHRIQPGREGGLVPEQTQALVHLEQRLLREVVGVGIGGREAAREPPHPRQVLGEQRLEGADVAVLRFLDEQVDVVAARHAHNVTPAKAPPGT